MTTYHESYDNLQPASIDKLRQIISTINLPTHTLDTAHKSLSFLSNSEAGSSEFRNTYTYIDYLISYPWYVKTIDITDRATIENILSRVHFSHTECKEKLLEYISSNILCNNNIKILVIDDEKIALKNLSHLLKKEGYNVLTCDNGEEAIGILEDSGFDIIMTDLRMANVDGIQILEKSKSICPDTHVILITGYATTETAIEAMRKGAFHYIVKPIQMDELKSIIKEALGPKYSKPPDASSVCLTGAADTAKTIGKAIADSLGRKHVEVQLTNITHESDINGKNRINGGISPGRIIKSICHSGTANPVVVLNDIDKLNKCLEPLLKNILNPDKNRYFVDHYLEVTFDLSGVFFIATASNAEGIPSSLVDSLEIVNLQSD